MLCLPVDFSSAKRLTDIQSLSFSSKGISLELQAEKKSEHFLTILEKDPTGMLSE